MSGQSLNAQEEGVWKHRLVNGSWRIVPRGNTNLDGLCRRFGVFVYRRSVSGATAHQSFSPGHVRGTIAPVSPSGYACFGRLIVNQWVVIIAACVILHWILVNLNEQHCVTQEIMLWYPHVPKERKSSVAREAYGSPVLSALQSAFLDLHTS
jgi:hypothetical protein